MGCGSHIYFVGLNVSYCDNCPLCIPGIVDFYRLWTGARRPGLYTDFIWQETGGVVPVDDRWEAGDPDMHLNHLTMAMRSVGTPSYGWSDYVVTELCESLCEAR